MNLLWLVGCMAALFVAGVSSVGLAILVAGETRLRSLPPPRPALVGLPRVLGLRHVGPDLYDGEIDGVRVQHRQRWDAARRMPAYLWRVEVPTGELSLRPQGEETRFELRFVAKGGPEALSWLVPPVRQALMGLPDPRIEAGVLQIECQGLEVQTVRDMLDLARILRHLPEDPIERMKLGAQDPHADVRFRSLAALAERDPVAGAALAGELQRDEDERVRGLAELVQHEERLEPLVCSEQARTELRLWAGHALKRTGQASQQARAARALLAGREPRLQGLGVELAQVAGGEGEPVLLEAISRAEGEVLGQLLVALREVGNAKAIPALRARQARLSVIHRGLSTSLEQTVQILSQRERGGLSLVGTPGALSRSETQDG